ncbi:MAG: NAD(P)-binding protein [Thermodesulfobacteriota bacterium]
MTSRKSSTFRHRLRLGMNGNITRRDFLNATLLGAGAMLLDLPAPLHLHAKPPPPDWYGYGGVGDYAASHGNTPELVDLFDRTSRGDYAGISREADPGGESVDLLVVGGGLSGLSTTYFYKKEAPGSTCLILENHPVFGGQAKRNEFLVNGERLIGPQASNSFVVIEQAGVAGYEMFSELGVPKRFRYQQPDRSAAALQFDRTNYGFALWKDLSPNVGYCFPERGKGGGDCWLRDLWGGKLRDSPYTEGEREDFLTWRHGKTRYFDGVDFHAWLDTMTYGDYLEKVMRLSPRVTEFAHPILASGLGLGCDAISAYAAYQISMPGFDGFTRRERDRRLEESNWHSFPGGNDGFSRYLLKALIPEAIRGENNFEDILNGPIDFRAMNRPGAGTRLVLGAMAVDVRHPGPPDRADHVLVSFVANGKTRTVRARRVVMAGGGWSNRRIVTDLPAGHREAYEQFHYSAVLVINVALTNWRFLHRLGITGCRWFDGFGFTCNIRQPMLVGDFRPPLHPDKPIVLTFYVPLHYPGLPVADQGARGRNELLATSFAAYEEKIRAQMARLFGSAGFDPARDIAGIILNRWLHAYQNPQPGFYFTRGGRPAPRAVAGSRHGRIVFGHAELDGHQNWSGAFEAGRRAARQALDIR